MLKKDLRLKYSKLRSVLSQTEITEKSIRIANAVLKLPIWNFLNYHIFLPIETKSEIDTQGIIAILLGLDKNIVVPKIIAPTKLEHYLLTDTTKFEVNALGVPEPLDGIIVTPTQLDVVFIPLLAFDKVGNRIGYGKGFYDRFLNECNPNIVKIGLSLFDAEDKISDVSPLDIPLDFCVTPRKTYSFKTS